MSLSTLQACRTCVCLCGWAVKEGGRLIAYSLTPRQPNSFYMRCPCKGHWEGCLWLLLPNPSTGGWFVDEWMGRAQVCMCMSTCMMMMMWIACHFVSCKVQHHTQGDIAVNTDRQPVRSDTQVSLIYNYLDRSSRIVFSITSYFMWPWMYLVLTNANKVCMFENVIYSWTSMGQLKNEKYHDQLGCLTAYNFAKKNTIGFDGALYTELNGQLDLC